MSLYFCAIHVIFSFIAENKKEIKDIEIYYGRTFVRILEINRKKN